MKSSPDLKQILTTGATFVNESSEVSFVMEIIDAGKMVVPGGRVLVGDYANLKAGLSAGRSFAQSEASVVLAVGVKENGDRRILLAELRFSERKPIWLEGIKFGRRDRVESESLGIFMLSAALGASLEEEASAINLYMRQELENNYQDTCTWGVYCGGLGGLAVVDSGFGTGGRKWFYGFDEGRDLCSLIVDLGGVL